MDSGYRREMADRFRALKTGPLELALDGADLRYVRFAGTEIVRRLYPAVRDEQWATPVATLEPALVSGYEDRIEVPTAQQGAPAARQCVSRLT